MTWRNSYETEGEAYTTIIGYLVASFICLLLLLHGTYVINKVTQEEKNCNRLGISLAILTLCLPLSGFIYTFLLGLDESFSAWDPKSSFLSCRESELIFISIVLGRNALQIIFVLRWALHLKDAWCTWWWGCGEFVKPTQKWWVRKYGLEISLCW